MTDPTYAFFSWSRRGAAARIAGPPDAATGRADASLDLSVQRLGAAPSDPRTVASPELPLFGPADVLGLDPVQVLRRSPVADDRDAEPNYLATIEFLHPDLPWLFSPQAPGGQATAAGQGSRLDPWIVLVVVEEQGPSRVVSVPGSPNPVLDAVRDELPDLAESWAWAHVQVLGHDATAEALLANPAAFGGAVRSRLICPRHLRPGARYVACVVPAFHAGVAVGLGSVPKADRLTARAWDTEPTIRLPVYHHWRFRTGLGGDFESLARRLRALPREQQGTLGQRVVLVDPVRSRLERGAAATFEPLLHGVPTAVTVPDTASAQAGQPGQPPGVLSPSSATPHPARDAINARLTEILDRPERLRAAGDDRPTVGPPMYGQWLARIRSIGEPAAVADGTPAPPPTPGWVTELNLDPETRSAAGAATSAVQHDQEALMASAWEQLETVVRANRAARWGQLFQTASGSLHVNRLVRRTPSAALRLASPALPRLRQTEGVDPAPPLSVQFSQAPAPTALFGPAFARASRFAGRFAGRAPISAVLDGVAPPLLEGRSSMRTRFDRPLQRLEPLEFGQLLKRAGLEERVLAATGLPIDTHVERLVTLPELITQTSNLLVLPEIGPVVGPEIVGPGAVGPEVVNPGPVGPLVEPGIVGPGAVGPGVVVNPGVVGPLVVNPGLTSILGQPSGPSVVVNPGALSAILSTGAATSILTSTSHLGLSHDEPAAAVMEVAPGIAADTGLRVRVDPGNQAALLGVATEVAQRISAGELVAPPAVALELQGVAAGGGEVSLVALQFLREQAVAGAGGQVVDLAERGRLTFTAEKVAAFQEVLVAGGVAAPVARTALHVATVERATLQAQFGMVEPFVPAIVVGLAPEGRQRLITDVDALMPIIAMPAAFRERPPLRPVPAETARATVVARLEPAANYRRMLSWLIEIDPGRARRRSPSDEVMAAPRFPEPFFDRIRRVDQEWILGGAGAIPPNSLVLMADNRRFVEAALVAANHEMARELLWRGYPTDLMGTSFARFWPTPPSQPGGTPPDDIAPVPDWTGGLGLNPPAGASVSDLTILVVKGELLRRYPETLVSAIPGKASAGPGDPSFTPGSAAAVPEIFRFGLAPDITCVGLAIAPDTLKQSLPGDEEWFIALTQPIDEPRFGLDETTETDGNAPDPEDLSWEMFTGAIVREHIGLGAGVAPFSATATSASIADALFQLPFQLLLRAREYLP